MSSCMRGHDVVHVHLLIAVGSFICIFFEVRLGSDYLVANLMFALVQNVQRNSPT